MRIHLYSPQKRSSCSMASCRASNYITLKQNHFRDASYGWKARAHTWDVTQVLIYSNLSAGGLFNVSGEGTIAHAPLQLHLSSPGGSRMSPTSSRLTSMSRMAAGRLVVLSPVPMPVPVDGRFLGSPRLDFFVCCSRTGGVTLVGLNSASASVVCPRNVLGIY